MMSPARNHTVTIGRTTQALLVVALLCLAITSCRAAPPRAEDPESTVPSPSHDLQVPHLVVRLDSHEPGRLHLAGLGQSATQPTEWIDNPVDWLLVRTADTQENRDTILADPLEPTVAHVDTATAAPVMVGIDFAPVHLSGSQAACAAYANIVHGASAQLSEAIHSLGEDGMIDVIVHRSAKHIVFASEGADGQARNMAMLSQTGQQAEIRPLMPPPASAAGGDVIFEVRLGAIPVDSLVVRSFDSAGHETSRAQVQPDGLCPIHLSGEGPWVFLLEGIEVVSAMERDAAPRVRLISTTLTITLARDGR